MSRALLVVFVCLLLGAGSGRAAAPKPPKLIVAILVDQLRADYLDRFHDQFSPGGFRLLLDRGTWLSHARYNYVPTITGPGHATFFSGAPPSSHGIIGNTWFDRKTLKGAYCVEDKSVSGVGTTGVEGRRSPRNFIGDNFSDEMRMRFQSKVIGISLKDRGAILPAGKKPAGAYWWDDETGNFVSSTYYCAALPEWVVRFNDRKLPQSYIGQKWARLLDEKEYQWPDVQIGEGDLAGEVSATFPHSIHLPEDGEVGFGSIAPTPFGNELLLEFALAALEGEGLGQGAQPDVFCISFSSVDTCGHYFGPYSQEVQDVVLRLDRQLEQLFKALDQKVGLANCVFVLTADHGVAPLPEWATGMGFEGQRFDSVAAMSDLVAKLTARFGTSKVLLKPALIEGNFYFDRDVMRQQRVSDADLTGFLREWALGTGYFQAAYGREQILEGRIPGRLGELVTNGFHAERSGDMVLLFKPFAVAMPNKKGTSHGTPNSYDTRVPVLFYGAPFLPGRFADDFPITDLVPTLAAGLHVTEPAGSIGKPLVRILAEQPKSK